MSELVMPEKNVYNIDSELLTTLYDLPDVIGPRSYNIAEEIEKRLGIPIKNQVIFFDGEKWRSSRKYRADSVEEIHLGYRPTVKTGEEYELYSKFNGSFVNVEIRNKFRGHDILETLNSRPFSTYLDLKLYIENKLSIPTDSQVILREHWDKPTYWERKNDEYLMNWEDYNKPLYWAPKNDEYLMDYMFDDGFIETPRENVIYLMIKESTTYVADNDDIVKIKPISIYSQHGPNEMIKIMTILPEENIFTIFEIKEKIKEHLGLPAVRLIIYRDANKCKKIFNEIDLKDLRSIFHCFDSEEEELVLYVTCDCRGDEKSSQICEEYGIRVLEVQIKTPSGNLIAQFQLTSRMKNKIFGSLKTFVEERQQLSRKKQLFYAQESKQSFHILNDKKTIWEHFGGQLLNRICTIYLFMIKTEAIDETIICDKLGIPQISPDILVKSLDGRKELLRTNMDRFENTSKPWLIYLTQDIEEKFDIPSVFVLSLGGNIIYKNSAMTRVPLKDLYFFKGVVREEIIFNLSIEPTWYQQVEEFCENHDIPTLKTLKVKFLTSELSVDLRNEQMESILKVKDYVSHKKRIPTSALDIFFNEVILNDCENLLSLYIKERSSTNSLELHVVVKTIKDVAILVQSPYTAKRLTLPVDYITMPGSKTFYHVKEEISSLTGIPISQLKLTCSQAPDVSDESFIQDVAHHRGSEEIDVVIWKTVTVKIVDNADGSTETQIHEIANDKEKVCHLLLRLNKDQRVKLLKKGSISRNTLLFNLGSEDIIELRKEEKVENSFCELM